MKIQTFLVDIVQDIAVFPFDSVEEAQQYAKTSAHTVFGGFGFCTVIQSDINPFLPELNLN